MMKRSVPDLLAVLICALLVVGGVITAPASQAATAIDARYAELGGAGGRLGGATGAEFCGLRGGGCQRNFERGVIIWSSATGAQPSFGAILSSWRGNDAENGRFGYPTGPEVCGITGGGCYQNFQGGAIIWSERTGAHISTGAIRVAWARTGFEAGRLGYPTTDEVCGLRGGGCYQNYQGGSIVWAPSTGAWLSVGAIRTRWASTGFENGALGYPITDERCTGSTCDQRYQRGVIAWTAAGGTVLGRDIDVAASSVVVVNKRRPLNPARYIPGPLVGVEGPLLRSDAAQQFSRLLADARAGGIAMVPISGYRSYDTQASLYASYVNRYGQATADLISARPGYSEHQTGLAVDIGISDGTCSLQECFAGTPAGAWAAGNAWRYGFVIRYPQGQTPVTGYAYEPWHLRYVGATIASEMRVHGVPTLEHYMNLPAAPSY
ncbi:D-alanyl-D-alanine carboxypeptidase family protein [Arthrobacter sp. NPDC092385]|uniref:D-alanyl-D-alanine carboxypeptidase family protein n=1 Tax=Arthrobacter sp. NPDC092385 TaxID=3363943 RepID=UPI0038113A1D